MSLPHQKRFFNPDGRELGCCICRLRNSTSVFTHCSKFTREEIADTYGLDPLSLEETKDRYGYMCNPCRLATKRYLEAKKKGSDSILPNLAQRLDSKLEPNCKVRKNASAVHVKEAHSCSNNTSARAPKIPQKLPEVGVREVPRLPHVVYTGVRQLRPAGKSPGLSPNAERKRYSEREVTLLREDKKQMQESRTELERETIATHPQTRNRRVQRQPVRNLKPRNVSFIDTSYFKKVQLPCVTLFVGEGDLVVFQADTFSRNCPIMTNPARPSLPKPDCHKNIADSPVDSSVVCSQTSSGRETVTINQP